MSLSAFCKPFYTARGVTLFLNARARPSSHAGRLSRRRVFSTSASVQGRQVVSTENAPGAVGPYSQAIKHGETLYVSGQVPLVPGTKNLIGEGIEEQTEQALKNLGAILDAAGSSFSQVLKTTVLLTDMGDFAKVNEVYGRFFSSDPPARACFAVKTLPLGAKVEIEAIAAL
ncbi:g12188 [Coccomyxa viridis]|uniref:G12188 protein n=1 Tax=Coccomyxa viridis TaxID=1274662 RepID=A0ABP1GDU5_9CHLO